MSTVDTWALSAESVVRLADVQQAILTFRGPISDLLTGPMGMARVDPGANCIHVYVRIGGPWSQGAAHCRRHLRAVPDARTLPDTIRCLTWPRLQGYLDLVGGSGRYPRLVFRGEAFVPSKLGARLAKPGAIQDVARTWVATLVDGIAAAVTAAPSPDRSVGRRLDAVRLLMPRP